MTFGEAAFSGRKALEGIIVGLILNRSVSVDIPGEFSYVKACRRACASLSCFSDFCLPNSLASIFLFYSLKLFEQNLKQSYILHNLYGQPWSVPTKILTGSSAELCCNPNKTIAEYDVFEEMCNHWYHFSSSVLSKSSYFPGQSSLPSTLTGSSFTLGLVRFPS